MRRNNRPPRQTFGRLNLEHLEAREVPANYVWWPQSGSPPMPGSPPAPPSSPPAFSDLNNWRVETSPTGSAQRLPDGRDDLIFIGNASTSNCVIPVQGVTSGNAFAGIHLLFGPVATPQPIGSPPVPPTPTPYSGTVTIQDSFSVGTLEVDCGAIKQADVATLQPPVPYAPTAGTLTITSTLHWTGGTLNSNTTAGTIALAPGASGLAEPSFTNPGINGTVYAGSDLFLQGTAATGTGSTFTMRNGNYEIDNGAGLRATQFCNLNLIPLEAPP